MKRFDRGFNSVRDSHLDQGSNCPDTTNPYALLVADVYANITSAFNWYVDALGGSTSSTQLDLQAVYEHELGHALGLDHPVASDSGGYTAVMECAISRGFIRRITGDDRNGLVYLYSGHSGWGNPEAGRGPSSGWWALIAPK